MNFSEFMATKINYESLDEVGKMVFKTFCLDVHDLLMEDYIMIYEPITETKTYIAEVENNKDYVDFIRYFCFNDFYYPYTYHCHYATYYVSEDGFLFHNCDDCMDELYKIWQSHLISCDTFYDHEEIGRVIIPESRHICDGSTEAKAWISGIIFAMRLKPKRTKSAAN